MAWPAADLPPLPFTARAESSADAGDQQCIDIEIVELAPVADDQLPIQFLIGLLLLAFPSRHGIVLGDVSLVRLPMAYRSKPWQVRGHRYRVTICGRTDRQVGEDARGMMLIGRMRRRKRTEKDKTCSYRAL
jgi:hypothetical protein